MMQRTISNEILYSIFKSKLRKYILEGCLRRAIGGVFGECDAFHAAFSFARYAAN